MVLNSRIKFVLLAHNTNSSEKCYLGIEYQFLLTRKKAAAAAGIFDEVKMKPRQVVFHIRIGAN